MPDGTNITGWIIPIIKGETFASIYLAVILLLEPKSFMHSLKM